MPKEKLNIAIYVIPGTDSTSNKDLSDGRYGLSSFNFVDWKSIKPLIIRNVIVLSKKTKRNRDDAE